MSTLLLQKPMRVAIVCTMNLQDLYAIEGAAFLNALHKATGINRQYLYQCATGRRQPSPRYALLLVRADGRLSLDAIYAGSAGSREVA